MSEAVLLQASARQIPLADEMVQCVVTSPPYWAKRIYKGVSSERWGGGWYGCLGLEPHYELYIEHMVEVMAEIHRVLRPDGVVWLNIGDSYIGSWGNYGARTGKQRVQTVERYKRPAYEGLDGWLPPTASRQNIARKNRAMIPGRLAIALQESGDWILRSEIVWHKPNAVPSVSVKDRPSDAHEMIYLLSKRPRYYYDDGSAIARTVWEIPTQQGDGTHSAPFPEEVPRRCIIASTRPPGQHCDCNEVIRTPLAGGADAGRHPATDPSMHVGRAGMARPRNPDAGTRPITRREQRFHAQQLRESPHRHKMRDAAGEAFDHYVRTDDSGARAIRPALLDAWVERGWLVREAPPCEHPEEPGDLVLDPFVGSGTTGLVAVKNRRRFVGLDVSAEYLELARKRIDPLGELQRDAAAAADSDDPTQLTLGV